jgi:hypothetical protein
MISIAPSRKLQEAIPRQPVDSRCWPINEVLMQHLVVGGKTDCQIADLYQVMPEDVTMLRTYYDL